MFLDAFRNCCQTELVCFTVYEISYFSGKGTNFMWIKDGAIAFGSHKRKFRRSERVFFVS